MTNLLYKDESYAIIGSCFEVYKTVGCGFPEAVYQECLSIEFQSRGIPNQAQPEVNIFYKDKMLNQTYRPDFICFDKIIIELKAVQGLTEIHQAQVHNYLHATGLQLGLLINFAAHPRLEFQRIILTPKSD